MGRRSRRQGGGRTGRSRLAYGFGSGSQAGSGRAGSGPTRGGDPTWSGAAAWQVRLIIINKPRRAVRKRRGARLAENGACPDLIIISTFSPCRPRHNSIAGRRRIRIVV